jgi:hypothetical protein
LLVSSSLEELQKSHGVQIQWRSFELRPAGTVLPPGYRERILAARPRFEQTAREQFGLEIKAGPFGMNNRQKTHSSLLNLHLQSFAVGNTRHTFHTPEYRTSEYEYHSPVRAVPYFGSQPICVQEMRQRVRVALPLHQGEKRAVVSRSLTNSASLGIARWSVGFST